MNFKNKSKKISKLKISENPQFLGMELKCLSNKASGFRQTKLIEKALKANSMEDCKPIDSPINYVIDDKEVQKDELQLKEKHHNQSIAGSLIYIAIKLRPVLALEVSMLRSFVAAPTKANMQQAKRTLKYLNSTKEATSVMTLGVLTHLNTYVDASWGVSIGRNRPTRAGIMTYYDEALTHATSFAQKRLTFSSTKSESVVLMEGCVHISWLRQVFQELYVAQNATVAYRDNSGSLSSAQVGPAKHFARRKHIDVRIHFLMQMVKSGDVRLSTVLPQQYSPTF